MRVMNTIIKIIKIVKQILKMEILLFKFLKKKKTGTKNNFVKNHAKKGGVLFASLNCKINMKNFAFRNNSAGN